MSRLPGPRTSSRSRPAFSTPPDTRGAARPSSPPKDSSPTSRRPAASSSAGNRSGTRWRGRRRSPTRVRCAPSCAARGRTGCRSARLPPRRSRSARRFARSSRRSFGAGRCGVRSPRWGFSCGLSRSRTPTNGSCSWPSAPVHRWPCSRWRRSSGAVGGSSRTCCARPTRPTARPNCSSTPGCAPSPRVATGRARAVLVAARASRGHAILQL